jgi:hypothetical protein
LDYIIGEVVVRPPNLSIIAGNWQGKLLPLLVLACSLKPHDHPVDGYTQLPSSTTVPIPGKNLEDQVDRNQRARQPITSVVV